MSTSVKVCRECGEEYRLEATRCADCGGELLEHSLDASGELVEPEGGEAEDAAGQGAPPVEQRVVFVTPRAADLVPFAEALRERQVPYRLAEQPSQREGAPPHYALLVPESEAAAALSALAPLLEAEGEADLSHLETRFEPERGYVQCPACGAPQPRGATECAECGLGLGAEDLGATLCSRCGAPLPEPEAACPACDGTPVAG